MLSCFVLSAGMQDFGGAEGFIIPLTQACNHTWTGLIYKRGRKRP